jgi:hypothetical protein
MVMTIANMTLEALTELIELSVERKLQALLQGEDPRSLEDVYASIDKNMWTPPPDAPSSTEMLREDRDH